MHYTTISIYNTNTNISINNDTTLTNTSFKNVNTTNNTSYKNNTITINNYSTTDNNKFDNKSSKTVQSSLKLNFSPRHPVAKDFITTWRQSYEIFQTCTFKPVNRAIFKITSSHQFREIQYYHASQLLYLFVFKTEKCISVMTTSTTNDFKYLCPYRLVNIAL